MEACSVIAYCSSYLASGSSDFYAGQVPRLSACSDTDLDLVGRACCGWGGLVDSPLLARATSHPATGTRAQIQPATATASREESGGQKAQASEAPVHEPPTTGLMMTILQRPALFASKLSTACDKGTSRRPGWASQVVPWLWICQKVENESAGLGPGKPCVR